MSDFKKGINYYIQASAGTGKTYNIIELLKVLTSNDDGSDAIPLNKILLVTYTEKAVGELKQRIRTKVPDINVDDSEVYTIHSFCQKMIKEFCLSCNMPINLGVIDDEEVESFVDGYIRDVISEEVYLAKKADITFAVSGLKKYLISAVNKYYLDASFNEVDSVISFEKEIPLIEDYFNTTSYDDLKAKGLPSYKIIEKLNTPASALAKALYDDTVKWFDSPRMTIHPTDITASKFTKVADKPFKDIASYVCIGRVKKNLDITKHVASKYFKDVYKEWILEKTKHQKQSFNDMIRYVREEVVKKDSTLLKKIREKYQYVIIDEFQDTNELQWDIFKTIFLDADPVSDKHNIVVVGDYKQSIYSFQGADVNVYEKAIDIMDKKGSSKMDLNKNFRASSDMINATNELFSTNGFINGFGPSLYPDYDAIGKPLEKKEATFDNQKFKPIWIVEHYEDKSGGEEEDDDKKKAKDKNPYVLDPNEYAKVVVSKILECCEYVDGKTRLQISYDKGARENGNVRFSDFTVLVKKRSELKYIKRELEKVGIPYSCYKDNTLFSGLECAQWIVLLSAIGAPDFTGRNRNLFKKALFTNFFGFSLSQISDPYCDSDDIKEIEIFSKWRHLVKNRYYDSLIDQIIVDTNIEGRMINDNQSLSIFKQIGDYATSYLLNNHTINELVEKLKNLKKKMSEDDDDDGSDIVGRGTDYDCVQLMTMHASKGLEFPVVIFAGNTNNKKPANASKAFLKHDGRKAIMTYYEDDDVVREEGDEWRRLYYVAFTRAQYLLILPDYNKISNKSPFGFFHPILKSFMDTSLSHYDLIEYDSFVYDLDKLKDIAKSVKSASVKSGSASASDEVEDSPLKELKENSKKQATYKYSYASLSHGHDKKEEDGYDKHLDLSDEFSTDEIMSTDPVEEDGDAISDFDKKGIQIDGCYDDSKMPITLSPNFPAGTSIGKALHEVFEVVDFNSYSDDLLTKKIEKAYRNNGISIEKKEWQEDAKNIFKKVLTASLPVIHGASDTKETFKLSGITQEDKKAEMEFNFSLDNELKTIYRDDYFDYFNGFIDLIFKRGDYYSVLDWKSDKLNDKDLLSYCHKDDLKNHTDNNYSIQRVLYSYCLVKWLHSQYKDITMEETYNKHFGGVYYVYIRGCNEDTQNGIYAHTWASWSDLEEAFKKIVKEKVGGIK